MTVHLDLIITTYRPAACVFVTNMEMVLLLPAMFFSSRKQ